MRLTSFYVCAPVCTPSRAGLLTGRYPLRSGLTRVLFPNSKDGIEDGEVTIAEALRERGYATACIGKWHLGHLAPFLPTRHGFDHYYGIPYSNDMSVPSRGDPPVPLMRNEETIEQPAVQETLTERYTEEAIRFIRANRDRPFFLYLPHTMPHVPIHVSDRFRGRSKGGLYGDVVETIDWSVGAILDAVDSEGLGRRTLVIFTSDNGPWLTQGKNGGSAGPLRNGKGTTYEGGMREPFIARWTGTMPAGRVSDQAATSLDLLPTLLRLSGGRPPRDRRLDGKDIRGVLAGRITGRSRDILYYRSESLEAIRSGRWKLHVSRREQNRERPAELYDLVADIGESRDLAAEHPDVVRRLARLAARMDADVRRGASVLKR
jgi:arylsulfatase A-like enzyme